MKSSQTSIASLILFSLLVGTVTGTIYKQQQERQVKKVTRVKKPTFSPRDWDGIYFENLFEDGLVGPRPEQAQPGMAASSNGQGAVSGESESASAEFSWARHIGRSTIEDEVKRIQQMLAEDITTPVKFRSDYAKARQSFAILSMTFAIIREYDNDVRWQRFAAEAQHSFERAAANARVGTPQAYESCKRRRDELTEMVRGGNFASDEPAPEVLDWSQVIDRSPAMDRLDAARDRLKKMTASKGEFTNEMASLMHEAEMVAAIAVVLTRENMNDADDEGYVELAMAMNKAALQIVEACRNQDYEAASTAANRVIQSCDDCHNEWQ